MDYIQLQTDVACKSNQSEPSCLHYKMPPRKKLKLVVNIAASIVLLITYNIFFGHQFIEKYLHRTVIITEEEEKYVSIPPPSNYHY